MTNGYSFLPPVEHHRVFGQTTHEGHDETHDSMTYQWWPVPTHHTLAGFTAHNALM